MKIHCNQTTSLTKKMMQVKSPEFQPRLDRTATPLNASVGLLNDLKKKSRTPEKREEKQDDVDLFLQPMAGNNPESSPARCTVPEVKFKIHSIVHDAEMHCCFPQMTTQFDMQSMSGRPNLISTCLMTSAAPDMQSMGCQHTTSRNLE
ncbi:hypothetical protein RRG08_060642 [Elysia crispata]|uniref:Uncharacterized protein n=1 Tax=Elysia crispata TaxID=231223 RepID=A0AAE0YPF2_9GAST|nr:hypothetical protein RRG08_060642 [Elysia crispata]